MTCPPVGIETSTPLEICGSSPIVTNSVVPMANPPIASASTASPKWRAVTDGTSRSADEGSVVSSVGGALVVITSCKTGPPGSYSPGVLDVTWVAGAQPSEAMASLNVADGRITAAAFSASGRK